MRPTRLEEPLDSYSAQELERWVLIRRSADVGWRRGDMKFSRNLWIKQKDVGGTYLVPGGRWLLVGGRDGSLTSYDLEASTITGKPLIQRDDQDKPQPIHHISIDIDSPEQTSNLTFTMALSAAVHFSSSPFPLKIHFWRVTLMGHSTEARLTTNHLCSIQAHDTSYISGVALRGNVYARIHNREDLLYIEVLDWEQSTSLEHYKAIILLGVKINAIRLLPGDRLLAFSELHMMIYNFVIVGGVEVTAPTTTQHVTAPIWKLPFVLTRTDRGTLSEGLSDIIATYFVVKARNILGLTVLHNANQAPHLRRLMEFDSPRYPTCAIGFERAFIQHTDRSTTHLSFSWERGEAVKIGSSSAKPCDSITSRDYPTTCNGARIPQLDEETGRIVQDLRDGFRVVDTAILYTDGEEVREDP